MNPCILFDNILSLSGAVLEARDSTDAVMVNTLHPVSYICDDLVPTTFMTSTGCGATVYVHLDAGTPISANAIGIKRHNLNSRGYTLQVQYSVDDTDLSWISAYSLEVPWSDTAYMKTWTAPEIAKRYWRIKFYSDAATNLDFYIGEVILGTRVDFPYPPEAPYYEQPLVAVNDILYSETGEAISAPEKYIRIDREAHPIEFTLLDREWAVGNYGDQLGETALGATALGGSPGALGTFFTSTLARGKGFFYAFDLVDRPYIVEYLRASAGAKLELPVEIRSVIKSFSIIGKGTL